ncbi:hypothetical protein GCM10008014_00700 [Paenibacillus silvae]|uniref:Uncharacterized protein n=1 Tax=Paenibacillus silvae TaxID=1325358 RepID=A0ABQ1YXD8_9BACL|nr:hypothetical protein GCM10008014_00700 [Paenibacillus silvae]
MNLINYLIEKDYGGVDIVNMYAYMCRDPRNLNIEISHMSYLMTALLLKWQMKETFL